MLSPQPEKEEEEGSQQELVNVSVEFQKDVTCLGDSCGEGRVECDRRWSCDQDILEHCRDTASARPVCFYAAPGALTGLMPFLARGLG